MKRAICSILVVFSTIFFQLTSYGQETGRVKHTYEDWEYVTNTSGITLTSYLGRESELEIPAEIHGIIVTMLGDEIFKNSSFLRSVNIPDSVSSIGRTAFQGCSSLKEIHLPYSLTRIEPYTFRYCTALETISLPEMLTVIGAYSFSGCISLTEIVIPDTVTSIGQYAFDDCTTLSNIIISKNLTYLDGYAFRNTPWLSQQTEEGPLIIGNTILLKWNGKDSIADIPYGVTMITDAFADNIYVESVIIPSTVTRIGPNAFRDAVNLKNIIIPDTVTRIDSYAFQGDRSLRSISLPESITSMGSSIFRGCERLTQIEFPTKISSIESYLLADCVSLTDVTIPSSVKSIHDTAFSGSDQVRLHVTFDSEAERFAQEQMLPYTYYLQQTKDFIYSRNDDGIQILKYIGNLFEVEVPAEIDGLPVNRINTAAFQNNSIVRRIYLPNTVKTIGDWAFSYMDSLKTVRISSGLVSLGADAFTGSSGLQVIVLPDDLETIGVEPFEGIEDLAICTGPDSSTKELLSVLGYEITTSNSCDENVFPDEFSLILTQTAIPTLTPSPTETPTVTSTPTLTITMTYTPTPALMLTSTATVIPSTPTNTPEPSSTFTPTLTQSPTMTPTFTQTPTMTPTATITPEPIYVLYIPDGSTEVTRDMLKNTADNLTLILPDSVTFISEEILAGHTLTLVGDSGTEAEAFARKWDIKFLVKAWHEMDNGETGGK
ncbi:MAG: leucine-rich repeat protein [Flexilinea sp.]|nr:leucine-rich repeat protein [Flexilinea sp.]